MSDINVSEQLLDIENVSPAIGVVISAGMPEHVGMHVKGKPGQATPTTDGSTCAIARSSLVYESYQSLNPRTIQEFFNRLIL